ncbi:TniQ family protein [Deinococcus marmoris]
MTSWLMRFASANAQPIVNVFGDAADRDARLPERITLDHLGHLSSISTFPVSKLEALLPRSNGHDHGWAADAPFDPGDRMGKTRALTLGHRKAQFCSTCLGSDPVPYLRQAWALDLAVACDVHGTALLDACPLCEAPFNLDLRQPLGNQLTLCQSCHQAFSEAPSAVTVKPEVIALQRDLLALRADEEVALSLKVGVDGKTKAALAQALFIFIQKGLLIQYFDADARRLTDWAEAEVVTGRLERRLTAAALLTWVFEVFPRRLQRLAYLAADPQAERHEDVVRDAVYSSVLHLIQQSSDGDIARQFASWPQILVTGQQNAVALQTRFQLTSEQWQTAEPVLARHLRLNRGPQLQQPRVVVDRLLEYLATDRSWPQVATPEFKMGAVLNARFNAWRGNGLLAELLLHLYEDLTGQGGVNLTHFAAARRRGRDPFKGDWRTQTATLLLAPRTLVVLQVDLPGLGTRLLAALMAERKG